MVTNTLWWRTLSSVTSDLGQASIDYTLLDASALFAQDVAMPVPQTLDVALQWDLFARAHALFAPDSQLEHFPRWDRFSFTRGPLTITMLCYYNTVIVTDPDRLSIVHADQHVWVKALDYFTRTLPASDPLFMAAKARFRALQAHNSELNAAAWNQDAYDAWVQRFGSPQEAGARIKRDPVARLAPLYPFLFPLAGKRVINLLGSHGSKAIAMALLGASVTVVDISQENAHYARSVAHASGVSIHYLISDVLTLPDAELNASYDLVFMELGVLHYFVDLEPLAGVIAALLRPSGRLVLQDFHPVSAKLISSKGKRHKVEGNYFDKSLTMTNVAFSKHLPGNQLNATPQVYLRKWTLGEVVTAVAQAGLFIRHLIEEPNSKIDDLGLPKTFTLVAEKLP
ncbi:MAG: hypothetical protein NVSMB44_39740 [Ktedonobacteraceae bacterium]